MYGFNLVIAFVWAPRMSSLFEIVASSVIYTIIHKGTLSNEEFRNFKNSKRHVRCDPLLEACRIPLFCGGDLQCGANARHLFCRVPHLPSRDNARRVNTALVDWD